MVWRVSRVLVVHKGPLEVVVLLVPLACLEILEILDLQEREALEDKLELLDPWDQLGHQDHEVTASLYVCDYLILDLQDNGF